MIFGKILEENNRQIRSFWLRCPRVVFDPLGDLSLMLLGPNPDTITIQRISLNPGLRQARMSSGPLGDNVRPEGFYEGPVAGPLIVRTG